MTQAWCVRTAPTMYNRVLYTMYTQCIRILRTISIILLHIIQPRVCSWTRLSSSVCGSCCLLKVPTVALSSRPSPSWTQRVCGCTASLAVMWSAAWLDPLACGNIWGNEDEEATFLVSLPPSSFLPPFSRSLYLKLFSLSLPIPTSPSISPNLSLPTSLSPDPFLPISLSPHHLSLPITK